MEALLISLIVLLSVVICAFVALWFYRAAREHEQGAIAPVIGRGAARNVDWDRAVRTARNRNQWYGRS